jgi:hypothetical protein
MWEVACCLSDDGTTDGIAVGRRWTIVDVRVGCALRPDSQWTDVAASGRRGRCGDYLQNRWSASLAMSTDGSFPSRPRQSRRAGIALGPPVSGSLPMTKTSLLRVK